MKFILILGVLAVSLVSGFRFRDNYDDYGNYDEGYGKDKHGGFKRLHNFGVNRGFSIFGGKGGLRGKNRHGLFNRGGPHRRRNDHHDDYKSSFGEGFGDFIFGDRKRGGHHGKFGGGSHFGVGKRHGGTHGGESLFENDDKHYSRSQLGEKDRAQARYSDDLKYGARAAGETNSDKGQRFAINDDLQFVKEDYNEEFVDFSDENRHKERSSTSLSFSQNHDKDAGSKTSFSKGSKSGSSFKKEQDKDLKHEEFNKEHAAKQSETELDTEKEEKSAKDSVLDAVEETTDESHQRKFKEDHGRFHN